MFDLYTDTSKKMKRLPFFLWGVGIFFTAVILGMIIGSEEAGSADKSMSVSLFEVIAGLFVSVLLAPLSLMRLNDIQKPHSWFWRPTIAYYIALFIAYLGTTALHSMFLSIIAAFGLLVTGIWLFGLGVYLTFKKGV